MAASPRIAIDVMGGDLGLHATLPASLASLEHHPDLTLLLVGCERQMRAALSGSAWLDSERLHLLDAPETVPMDERPSQALRLYPRSSMRLALEQLAGGRVDAVLSAGNTGALMALGMHILGTLPGVDRPAICAQVPTRSGHTYLLDLGANVDCDAELLHQFAQLGSTLVTALEGSPRPRVALLNIGREAVKGNDRVRLAASRLEADAQLHYTGFVEGDSLFLGEVDVVVCDGFVGNIALKVCEGTAALVAARLREGVRGNWRLRLFGRLAAGPLRDLYRQLDPRRYNGACLLGLDGTVFKSHGGSGEAGFGAAIERTLAAVRQNLDGLLRERWRH